MKTIDLNVPLYDEGHPDYQDWELYQWAKCPECQTAQSCLTIGTTICIKCEKEVYVFGNEDDTKNWRPDLAIPTEEWGILRQHYSYRGTFEELVRGLTEIGVAIYDPWMGEGIQALVPRTEWTDETRQAAYSLIEKANWQDDNREKAFDSGT